MCGVEPFYLAVAGGVPPTPMDHAATLIRLEKGLFDHELEETTLYDDRVKHAPGHVRQRLGA